MRSGTLYFNYQFDSSSTLERSSRYINPVNLNIYFLHHAIYPDNLEKIGEIVFDRVFTSDIVEEESFSVFDIFDEDNEFYATTGFKITNGHQYHKSIIKRWKELLYHEKNFIYIYNFWLKPEFRGQKIILKAILDLISQFRIGINLVVISTKFYKKRELLKSPILSESEKMSQPINISEALAIKKMRNHLGGIGFEVIRGFPDLMFLLPENIDYEVYEKFDISGKIELP
jgi:hypothetical protein